MKSQEELDTAMAAVEAHWRSQAMTAGELDTWRRMLRAHPLDAVLEVLDAMAPQFPRFRPDTGRVIEALQAHARRCMRDRDEARRPEEPSEPPSKPERAAQWLAECRQKLGRSA